MVATLPSLEKVAEFNLENVAGAAFKLPYAYLSGNRFSILNLANPAKPEQVQTATDINPGPPIAISGNRLYSFDTFGEFGMCWSMLLGLDITNPAVPDFAFKSGNKVNLACPYLLKAIGNQLFVIDWDGLSVIDLTNLDDPIMKGKFSHLPAAVEVAKQGFLYTALDRGPKSLWVHDVRNLQQVRSFVPFDPRWVQNPVISGGTLYAPVWQDGLAVIDVSNPTLSAGRKILIAAKAAHYRRPQSLGDMVLTDRGFPT